MRETGNDTCADGINVHHDDRDRRRRLLGRQARRRAFGNQDIHLETDQLDPKVGEAIYPAPCIAALDAEVPTLDVLQLAQPLSERAVWVERNATAAVAQEPYPVDLPSLLRVGGERRGEGTGQRGQQEAAAVHAGTVG